MPVYNEERYILNSITSIQKQNYNNWNLIVINDGSTDNTKSLLDEINDDRVIIVNKKNSDQLNSLLSVESLIYGDLVYLLHGDDEISSNDVFDKIVSLYDNEKFDYLSYPYNIINSDGLITETRYPNNIVLEKYIPANALLNFGRNFKADHFFCTKKYFLENVKPNYLKRNIPFWMSFECSNVSKISFPLFNYRLHGENYINNKVGLLNVCNGNVRSILILSKLINIPIFKYQRYLFKIYNKIGFYGLPVLYFKKSTRLDKVIKIIKEYFSMMSINYNEYESIRLTFLYLENDFNRVTDYSEVFFEQELGPKDVRLFNSLMANNQLERLPTPYFDLYKDLKVGLGKIICSKENFYKIVSFLDLLNVTNVDIEMKNGN